MVVVLLKKEAEMKLMKCLTLTQKYAKRDEMQSFCSMNSNYIREKVFFFPKYNKLQIYNSFKL
jgi:hypothetical protein